MNEQQQCQFCAVTDEESQSLRAARISYANLLGVEVGDIHEAIRGIRTQVEEKDACIAARDKDIEMRQETAERLEDRLDESASKIRDYKDELGDFHTRRQGWDRDRIKYESRLTAAETERDEAIERLVDMCEKGGRAALLFLAGHTRFPSYAREPHRLAAAAAEQHQRFIEDQRVARFTPPPEENNATCPTVTGEG